MSLPDRKVPLIHVDERTGLITTAWVNALQALEEDVDGNAAGLTALAARVTTLEAVPAPAFTAIAAFDNGWTNFSAVWSAASYCVDHLGFVHLMGLIKSGTIALSAFTLPVEARPAKKKAFATACETPPGRVDVASDGTVTPQLGTNGFYSLEGITFLPGT